MQLGYIHTSLVWKMGLMWLSLYFTLNVNDFFDLETITGEIVSFADDMTIIFF